MKPLEPEIPPRLTENEIAEKIQRHSEADRAEQDARNAAIGASERAKRGIPARYAALEPSPWRGGLLIGEPGTGKTHEACRRLLSVKGAFFRVADLIEMARLREFGKLDDAGLRRLSLSMAEPPIVIDDLGTRRATPFALDTLYDVIDSRWTYSRETLVTSNMTLEEIAASWGQRIVSRILGFGPVEKFEGRDWRL